LRRFPAIAIVVVCMLGIAAPAAGTDLPSGVIQVAEPAPPTSDETTAYAPDRVIVRWEDEALADDVMAASGLTEVETPVTGAPVEELATGGQPVEQILVELNANPAVAYAEPDYVVELTEVAVTAVNDSLTADQYSLDRMAVRAGWGIETGASNLIAVLDTGVDFTHPDLAGRTVTGYDFVHDDGTAADDNGHGTWVSGIIAAKANNGAGVAGITWSDKILPVKIMDANGTGSTSDLARGIRYAADRGAKVINMSVGGFPTSQAVEDAVDYAWGKGAVLIGAAGNNGIDQEFYPASYAHVVSVSATQLNDEFTNWSSFGPSVDVSAPGASVLTTNCASCMPDYGSYTYISGTSFAAPNTAGVVALMRARYPDKSNQWIVDRLKATSDDLGYPGWDRRYGVGRVNAYRALGGSPPAAPRPGGDGLEANNALASARSIPLGTVRPSIYPAGDVDYVSVSAPRAGRLTVSVTAVDDTRPWPWVRSALHVDPVLEVYRADGTRVVRVDNATNSFATERASITMAAAGRIVIKVSNHLPNGNRSAYTLATAYLDNAAPTIASRSPAAGTTNVSRTGPFGVTFNEAVTGVTGSTLRLKDANGMAVAASVRYDSATRTASIAPASTLAAEARYTVSVTSGIHDVAGNALAASSWSLVSGTRVVARISGADRYAAAAALSRASLRPGVALVALATGTNFPDALAGAPLAAANGGPVLLVTRDTIPSATATELRRLAPRRIVILGGTASVSDAVLRAARGYTAGGVTRLAGADRYAAAAAISRAFAARGVGSVYVAVGTKFPDALAGAAVAARDRVPVLLVGANSIPAATATELTRLAPGRIVLLGGTASVSERVRRGLDAYTRGSVTRLAGADRYAAAAAISRASYAADGPAVAYVATGEKFPDALAAAALAGRARGPVLLVPHDRLPSAVAAELRRLDPAKVIIVGGPASVSEAVRIAIAAVWR
jgi:subtilisin family serine protease/putative cell wall-binding protein